MKQIQKQLLDTELGCLNTASKKVVLKTGKFLGNKTTDTITKSNDDKIVKTKPAEEINIPPEKG